VPVFPSKDAFRLKKIDEAQDVAIEKYDRDLRPMASTTNATTVLYGTAWSDDTLLAIERAREPGVRGTHWHQAAL
jgi:hypothetical protein